VSKQHQEILEILKLSVLCDSLTYNMLCHYASPPSLTTLKEICIHTATSNIKKVLRCMCPYNLFTGE
jgi:hypothetical protein